MPLNNVFSKHLVQALRIIILFPIKGLYPEGGRASADSFGFLALPREEECLGEETHPTGSKCIDLESIVMLLAGNNRKSVLGNK